MKLPEQGEKMMYNGLEAFANSFTLQEMFTIYMSVSILLDDVEEKLKILTPTERKEQKENIGYAKNVINKINKTFKAMGIDIEKIFQ